MSLLPSDIGRRLDKEIASILNKSVLKNKVLTYTASQKRITSADFFTNKMFMMIVIREGVPYSLFNIIRTYAPFSLDDWAIFLNLSTKSLQRYEQASKVFKPIHAEKIIEMAEVTHLGLEVFGDAEKLKLWLDTPSFALGNMKPIELLKDSYGKDLVMSELTRIEHGILAWAVLER